MEYKPLAELQVKEDVSFLEKQTPMTREQRLERWIELLQRNAGRRLRSLQEIRVFFPRHPDVRAAPTIRRWPSHMQTPFCVQPD